MKKIDLSLDFDKIKERIEHERDDMIPSKWAIKVGVSINVVTNIHGKTNQKPSLEYVVAVARATGKPVDWYLYGEPYQPSKIMESSVYKTARQPECPIDCGDELRDICRDVKYVMEEDGDFADALKANIKAFRKSVEIDRRLKNLEEGLSAGRDGGTLQEPARRTARKRKAG